MVNMLSLALVLLPASAFAATYTVQVGATNHEFTPSSLKTNAGDVINFVFPDGAAHTVTPSVSYDQPCVAASGSAFPSLQSPSGGGTVGYTSPDSNTVWIHSSTNDDCQRGMVFALNPPSDKSVDNFAKIAEGKKSGASANLAGSGMAALAVLGVAGAMMVL